MSDDLFAPLTSTPAMRAEVSGRAWLQAMLDAEAALAEAAAAAGLVPAASARAVRAAATADDFDLPAIAEGAVDGGNPVIPMLAQLRARVPEAAADAVHIGATSQDIIDTATVLVARRAWSVLDAHLVDGAAAAADLASAHRSTLMPARTLLQHALPTTFGLKAAGWLVALIEARQVLADVVQRRLAAQLGGAAGTLAAFGDQGLEVAAAFAAALGLPEPVVPWHTARGRIGELAGALGVVAGVCDKAALDIGLLAQTEVGEVREAGAEGRGGSSTLPHKRNPVGVARVRAAALRARGQVTILLAAMAQEHERALGAWSAEWPAVTDLFIAVDATAGGLADVLGGLEVDAGRMAANLDLTDGLVMAEAVAGALVPTVGRRRAREFVEAAAGQARDREVPFRDELLRSAEVAAVLDPAAIDALLDPGRYVGAADALIDRALAAWKADELVTSIDVNHRVDGPPDAPVLVLSNSLGTDLRLWDQHVPELSERFRVVRYDHRGHGGSPVPAGPYTMTELAGDVVALLDRLDIERASFCGVSMGGMVGMALATAAPERVERLVLVCTSAHMPPREIWDERIAAARADGTAALADGTMARWFTESFRASDPSAVTRARDMVRATPDEGYAACCEAIRDMDQRDTIGSITAPTLVIAGEDDPSTPPEHGALINERIAGSSMVVIPHVAHLAVLERPEEVRAAVLGFLTKAAT